MADETAAKEAANTAFTTAQDEYAELARTTVAVCQELEGSGTQSGSSVASRLRALGGRIAEHAKSTFRLGVLRALAVASTHYLMDLQRVSSGYVVPDDADADAASAIMDEADAAVGSLPQSLPRSSKPTSLPLLNSTPLKTRKGGMVACRKTGPRSPCNRLLFIVITLCNHSL